MPIRPKCRHGNSLIKLTGCAKCCQPLLDGGNLLNVLDVDAGGLLALILNLYPTHEELAAACENAKKSEIVAHQPRPATVAAVRASPIPSPSRSITNVEAIVQDVTSHHPQD